MNFIFKVKKSKYILVDMGYYSGNSILKKLKNKLPDIQ